MDHTHDLDHTKRTGVARGTDPGPKRWQSPNLVPLVATGSAYAGTGADITDATTPEGARSAFDSG